MSVSTTPIDQLAINTIRTLAMDGVQAANSGHPGAPMALAPAAYLVFNEVLRYDPAAPDWMARDRFVLSCGHASMLLYAMLHLTEVPQIDDAGLPTGELAVPLQHIRCFRQLHSRCPGHPEYGDTTGVETTTGPLGQGVANSVGMAMAARWLAETYDRPGFELFGFRVYAMCSDGDLMEGVAGEAASLAGHLKLGNLCWIYDDNGITIEGKTDLAFSEDVISRFVGYGWNVIAVEDINDLPALRAALQRARECDDRPTLIRVRSVIAYGAPNKADTHGAHGAPLGEEEVRLTKEAYGWPGDEDFFVPAEVREHFRAGIAARGSTARAEWEALFAQYAEEYPQEAAETGLIRDGQLPERWDAGIPDFPADEKGMASRASSGKVLNEVARRIPWMIGGSADLAPSNNTLLKFDDAGHFGPANHAGRNLHFGIREHAMAAACNGMALCGLRPYAGTFFVFSDYLRPALRLSAMMGLPVLYIFTHDSIGVGEDGPTHQPVEHLAALRAIPNLVVIRPGDANEVAEAYRVALSSTDRPTALVLTRQNLPTLDRQRYAAAAGLARGGYVLADAPGRDPEVILIGTGSELAVAVAAYEKLCAEGLAARVVSLPSWELFGAQPADYRDAVLPPQVTARVAVEAGIRQGWEAYTGCAGRFVGMEGFGASAPFKTLYEHFGITADAVAAAAKAALDAGK